MRIDVTEIYRIETMNSTYEIKVIKQNGELLSSCKKMGTTGAPKQVQVSGTEYLEKLTIGASFEVPGVVLTSVVCDYLHFVLSTEPKRTTIPAFFGSLAEAIIDQIRGVNEPVLVPKEGCQEPECSYSSNYGPTHEGSRMCKSGSIASGGTRAHCSCDFCF